MVQHPRTLNLATATVNCRTLIAAVVLHALRSHPRVNIMQENPSYVPPEELLRELKGRVASEC